MRVNKLVRQVLPKLDPFIPQLEDLPIEDIKEILGIEKVYKLSFNENPLGPSPKAILAMQKELNHLHRYPHSSGENLLNGIAQKEGIAPEQIILSNGADEMIHLVAQTFIEPFDEVIIPELTFGQYLTSTHLMGGTPILVPMNHDLEIDLNEMLKRITPKTKLIFLCNPNNPTGKAILPQDLADFLQQVPEHVLIVIDEAYHEYGDAEGYSSGMEWVKEGKQVLIIRTFSKLYALAAARIGYGIGSAEIVHAIHHARAPFNVNAVAQVGALASLEDIEHIAKIKHVNQLGKQLLYKGFTELGLSYHKSHTNFVYVDTGIENEKVFAHLAKHGVIVRKLSGYGLTTSLRISVGMEEEVEALINALKEVI